MRFDNLAEAKVWLQAHGCRVTDVSQPTMDGKAVAIREVHVKGTPGLKVLGILDWFRSQHFSILKS